MSKKASEGKRSVVLFRSVVCVAVLAALWYWVPIQPLSVINYTATQWGVHVMPILVSLFQQNQFVQVVAFGSVSAYVCYLANQIYRVFILPLFTGMQCSVVIHNTDPNFYAVIDFISDRLLLNVTGAQYSLQANTKVKESKTRKDYIQEWLRGQDCSPPELVYRPDNDQVIHTITYQGRQIFVERAKSSPLMGRDKPFTPESLKLTTWGNDNTVLKELMTDAVKAACKELRDGIISIYTLSSGWCSGWELALTKKARPKDSVILDMQDMDILLEDARNFLQSGRWYVDMGIPYRRGYLLYGPPGCGKTSFAQVLAGELQLDICILNLTHEGLTDNAVAECLRDAPQNAVIVLEDVDAIFVERTVAKDSGGGGARGGNTTVSFSGLLNALDGVASQEGRLLFMTTNHIEKLDPALIRPGRCDVQLQLKLASKNQMERMFLRFYPGEEALAKAFAASLPANELSMAALQGYFLKCSGSAQACVDHTSDLLHANRPAPPVVKSIYEHLRRVGLERYAAVLEFNGIATEQDLAGAKLDDLLKLSFELQYDFAAQKLFSKLLDADNKKFSVDSYALAEVTHIRELFLAAYADTADDLLLKTVCAPALRHHSHSAVDCPELREAIEGSRDRALTQDSDSVFSTSDSSALSSALGQVDPSDLTEPRLRELCKAFCAALSNGGKGIISHYNLRRLLDAHPRRPSQCVKAAAAFTAPRGVSSQVVQPMDLYAFVKRLGLGQKIHSFIAGEVDSLGALVEVKGSVTEIHDNARRLFKIDREYAKRVAEVVSKTMSESGNLVNFGLFPRSRIMEVFRLYYTVGSSAFPLYTERGNVRVTEDSDAGTDGESTQLGGAGADGDSTEGEGDTTDEAGPGMGSREHERCAPSTALGAVQLERLSFEFGLATTDAQGTSVVSMLEVLDHLRRYPSDPVAAVRNAPAELVSPPYPAAPAAVAPPEVEIEWVDEWLKSAPGGDLSQYAQKFKDQGFVQRADFLVGAPLTLDELEMKVGVPVLAHRRRLVAMHAMLVDGDREGQMGH